MMHTTAGSRLARWLLPVLLVAAPVAAAQTQALPAWDQLTPTQREQLIAPTRERWNAEPAQRAELLERAQRWQQMTPEQLKHAHRGVKRWRHMSDEQRAEARALYTRMRSLDEDQRRALKAKWRAMTAAQRTAWVKAHPAPDRECEE